ncbi:MAG: glycine betaine/L-proline ABC transporter substrate-binding protein ProX [Cyanobacteria bacterium J06592_8]
MFHTPFLFSALIAETPSGIEVLLNPFQLYTIPLDDWITTAINFLVDNFRPLFQTIRVPISWTLETIGQGLTSIPPLIFLILMGLIAWQLAGRGVAIYSIIALTIIGLVDAWEPAIVSLSLVLTAVVFSVLIGIPIGIACAKNDQVEKLIGPILDVMQTLPTFVYLVPVVMLFGIGDVPGVIATIIYATPPLIRLTNLGIRQVPFEAVEAALAFGSTPAQVLVEVELPLAMPAILTGLNQTILFALGMSVIAAMIAVPGLGLMVLQGVGRLDVGLATVGGFGIVLIAIMLDRITQAVGKANSKVSWKERGPVGFVRSRLQPKTTAAISIILVMLWVGGIAYQQILQFSTKSTNTANHPTKIRSVTSRAEYALFLNQIVNIGLEKLGYQVETPKQLDTTTVFFALNQGDVDFTANYWENLQRPMFKNSRSEGKLQQVGAIVKNAVQGYQIDLKTAQEYNITSLEQLQDPEIAKLFDSNGDGKANLIGCNAGWLCESVIFHHLEAYGLQDTVELEQGIYPALIANVITRYQQGKPILYYTWTPNWIASALELDQDVVWLEVPFTALPEDMTAENTIIEGKNLGFAVDQVRFVVNQNFLAEHPMVKAFFELVEIPIADINEQQKRVNQGENKPLDIYRHAEEWVQNHQQLFESWIESAQSNSSYNS